jgi:hypothetical protein
MSMDSEQISNPSLKKIGFRASFTQPIFVCIFAFNKLALALFPENALDCEM